MGEREDLRKEEELNLLKFGAFRKIHSINRMKVLSYWILTLFGLFFIVLFLPWTQNVEAMGSITTLRPEQRPQTVNTVIGGQVDEWFVIEGQHVMAGDTIVHLKEAKTDYFDEELVLRTQEQLVAKQQSVGGYQNKVLALESRINALRAEFRLKRETMANKLDQAKLTRNSDSTEFQMALVDLDIAERRFIRSDSLFNVGLKSLTDLETKRLKLQETRNKSISKSNKLTISTSKLTNAQLDLVNLENSFQEKLSKAQSDLASAQTSLFAAQGDVSKLRNKLRNYTLRQSQYFVVAPQNGFIIQTHNPGIGDVFKEGAPVVTIMPEEVQLAVQLYVKPVDLPLIKRGERLRLLFDGWPAMVFSGWPGASFGSFGGEVYAIDRVISANGKYRILIIPDGKDENWPEPLRAGSAAHGIFLLNDVPVWYELWRQINGFPPDYYDGSQNSLPVADGEGGKVKKDAKK